MSVQSGQGKSETTPPDMVQLFREVEAARAMRDAILAYERAEERGFTRKAIQAFNDKERACEHYDAVRAGKDVQP